MPVGFAHMKLVLGGPMDTSGTWSIGLTCVSNGAQSNAAMTAWLAGIASDVGTSYAGSGTSSWGSMAAPNTKLSRLAAYHYAGGSNTADAQAEYLYGTPIAGSGGASAPSKIACCVSLLSDTPGRHGRGRVYVPADGAGYAQHQWGSAAIGVVGKGIRDLIDHINGSSISGQPVDVVIGSATPTAHGVTRVRTDSLPDTQRPRAQGETALYTFTDNV